MKKVFVTGGTGHIGRALSERLVERGHAVSLLVRPGSEPKAPRGTNVVVGDAFVGESYEQALQGSDAFVHLIGVSHPAPWKRHLFEDVDYRAAKAALDVACRAHVPHFVYMSVAQPAPIMKAYVRVRARVEKGIAEAGLPATILRPWYVLGPGRRWPLLLKPLYWWLENQSATRSSAQRLALLRLEEMVDALQFAVENPPTGLRVWDVPDIRKIASFSARA